MKKISYLIVFLFTVEIAKAQQGFGTSTPAPSSVIDMRATDKGALLPRVNLTNTIVAAPVISPTDALTVFNTNTAGDVTPGYYYWSAVDSKWVRLLTTALSPWNIAATTTQATLNTQDIYQMGKVGIGLTTPTSTLQTNGSVAAPIKVVSSNYTLTDKDYTLILSGVAAVNTITVTFPQASTCPGRIYIVVNYTAPAANTVAVNPQMFSSFDGTTAELKALSGTANPAATVITTGSSSGPSAGIQVSNMRTVWQSDGTTWWLISL